MTSDMKITNAINAPLAVLFSKGVFAQPGVLTLGVCFFGYRILGRQPTWVVHAGECSPSTC